MKITEGGNLQLQQFFERHHMGNDFDPSSSMTSTRYRTKAALYYKSNLKAHVEAVVNAGPYKGREAARRKHQHHQAKQTIHNAVTTTTQIRPTKGVEHSLHQHAVAARHQ